MARQAAAFQSEADEIQVVSELTGVFESIASLHIGRIKDRVTRSQRFFDELWQIYAQLRVDPKGRMIGSSGPRRDKPNVFLVLTSDSGLSGDIDQRIVQSVINSFDPTTTDLIVIGARG